MPTTIKGLLIFFATLADKDNLSSRVIWQLSRPFNEGAASRVVSWQLLAGVMQSLRELILPCLPCLLQIPLEAVFLVGHWCVLDKDSGKKSFRNSFGLFWQEWCFKLSLLTEQSVSFNTHHFYTRLLIDVMVHPKFSSELLTNSSWGTLPTS